MTAIGLWVESQISGAMLWNRSVVGVCHAQRRLYARRSSIWRESDVIAGRPPVSEANCREPVVDWIPENSDWMLPEWVPLQAPFMHFFRRSVRNPVTRRSGRTQADRRDRQV